MIQFEQATAETREDCTLLDTFIRLGMLSHCVTAAGRKL